MALNTAQLDSVPRAVSALDWIALILVFIGGINWGLVGAFHFNLVDWVLGADTTITRVVYVIVGLAAIYLLVFAAKMSSRTR